MSHREEVKSEGQTWDGGVFSHFPFLATAIATTKGPILECGAGWGSSPLIHYLSGVRKVITVDTDDAWLRRFANGYSNPNHEFIYLNADGHHPQIQAWIDYAKSVASTRWGVVFLDQAPGEARVPCASVLKDSADFIVCHDTCADRPGGGGNYGWKLLDGVFKYQRTVNRIRPSTTIYSNVRDFVLEPCDI